ncbi:MAG: hypothetical protein COA69_00470 [Robiginitomaculum sp.]|nr:MAG: hypothetical protein COA69_00470 [Robiginitomaculum sp.]
MSKLPVLDVSGFMANPEGGAGRAFAHRLREMCHTTGFCYVVGHGIEARDNAQMMQMSRQFFALALAERKQIEILNSPHFRGYTILGDERTGGNRDWRDQIDFGMEREAHGFEPGDPDWLKLRGPNQWPEALPEMRPVVLNWMRAMQGLGQAIMGGLAVGLGQSREYFDANFVPEGDARLKLIRYHAQAGVSEGLGQGVGWHHDTGLLSFILQDEIGGLQVDIDGQIIDVTPMEGAFVMNLGEMLQVATNGYFRATQHRVVSPPRGLTRHSIAFFFNPTLETKFAPVPLPPELAAQARGTQNADPNDPVFSVFGQNVLKTRLRAHPDVAERHYK